MTNAKKGGRPATVGEAHVISVRLGKELFDRLQKVATKHHRQVSEIARLGIEMAIEKGEKAPAPRGPLGFG